MAVGAVGCAALAAHTGRTGRTTIIIPKLSPAVLAAKHSGATTCDSAGAVAFADTVKHLLEAMKQAFPALACNLRDSSGSTGGLPSH